MGRRACPAHSSSRHRGEEKKSVCIAYFSLHAPPTATTSLLVVKTGEVQLSLDAFDAALFYSNASVRACKDVQDCSKGVPHGHVRKTIDHELPAQRICTNIAIYSCIEDVDQRASESTWEIWLQKLLSGSISGLLFKGMQCENIFSGCPHASAGGDACHRARYHFPARRDPDAAEIHCFYARAAPRRRMGCPPQGGEGGG